MFTRRGKLCCVLEGEGFCTSESVFSFDLGLMGGFEGYLLAQGYSGAYSGCSPRFPARLLAGVLKGLSHLYSAIPTKVLVVLWAYMISGDHTCTPQFIKVDILILLRSCEFV